MDNFLLLPHYHVSQENVTCTSHSTLTDVQASIPPRQEKQHNTFRNTRNPLPVCYLSRHVILVRLKKKKLGTTAGSPTRGYKDEIGLIGDNARLLEILKDAVTS